ncbi:hypothetical protein M1555_02445 [Patescibacteria group bacterium]|nr:hypothetical protein [Patescibacteria group bacterium]
MEKKIVPYALLAGLLILHLAYLLHTHFTDWPEMLFYPWFLTKGMLYYRDVVLAYVPGAYYILYALYRFLGFTPASLKVVAYGFILLSDAMLFVIAGKLLKGTFLACIVLLFFIFWQPIFDGNGIWYETILLPFYLLGFSGVYGYTRLCVARRDLATRSLLAGSAAFAVAVLIKQTAFWPLLFSVLFLVGNERRNLPRALGSAALFLSLPVMGVVATWLYFAVQGAGGQFFFWVFRFPLLLTRPGYDYILPPSPGDVALIAPAFIPLSVLAWWFVKKRKRPDASAVLTVLFAVSLFMAGLPRWGAIRIVPSLAFAALATGFFLRSGKRRLVLPVMVLVLIGAAHSAVKFRERQASASTFFGPEYRQLGSFLARETRGKPLFVFGNFDDIYMFLNETPRILPWTPLFPWNAKIPGVQEALVRSFDRAKVPYVAYIPYHRERSYYDDYYPVIVGAYIMSHYTEIAPLPVYGWLMKRNGL